jgi:hypothetical protein
VDGSHKSLLWLSRPRKPRTRAFWRETVICGTANAVAFKPQLFKNQNHNFVVLCRKKLANFPFHFPTSSVAVIHGHPRYRSGERPAAHSHRAVRLTSPYDSHCNWVPIRSVGTTPCYGAELHNCVHHVYMHRGAIARGTPTVPHPLRQ